MEVNDNPCIECEDEDHFGSTSASVVNKAWNGDASRFTDQQYKMSCAACGASGPPKSACFLPHHEPGGAVNRNGVHAAAGRVSALKGKDPAAVARAKSHLRGHYSALKEDPPPSISASTEVEGMAGHGTTTGKHSHDHPTYGGQGADDHHAHTHSHSSDNDHHHHGTSGATLSDYPAGVLSFMAAGDPSLSDVSMATLKHVLSLVSHSDNNVDEAQAVLSDLMGVKNPDMDDSDSSDPDMDDSTGGDDMAVTQDFDMRGASWGIRQEDSRWVVVTADGSAWEGNPAPPEGGHVSWSPPGYESYTQAVAAIAEELAVAGTRPVLSQTWRSEMAFEDRSTGDGRRIADGAITYRNCPLPLMLQTQTAGGHMGAVLCGAINETGKMGKTSLGQGDFDQSQAGNQALQIIEARGRFGVSIDVAEAEGELECTSRDDEGFCTDGEMVFSMIKIMGLTLTPFPAFEDAYIELSTQPAVAQASGQWNPSVYTTGGGVWNYANGGFLPNGYTNTSNTPIVMKAPAELIAEVKHVPIVAGAKPQPPPLAWFEDPQFAVGDGRLVCQPNGTYACPLSIEGRRVFGHMAAWRSCHTGYSDRCVPPPHSRTGYAAFMDAPLMAYGSPLLKEDGRALLVGQLSMGCGHASDDPSTSLNAVRDHYDGGPGAIQMADVCVGEDQFGIWFAGSIRPEATESQIRKFASCAVSGDWREVWRGKGLDLVACLAGVTSPGFPISAMAASASPEDLLPASRARWRDGEPVVLVAAGVVRQPLPWERAIGELVEEVASQKAEIAALQRLTATLREDVVADIRNNILALTNGH